MIIFMNVLCCFKHCHSKVIICCWGILDFMGRYYNRCNGTAMKGDLLCTCATTQHRYYNLYNKIISEIAEHETILHSLIKQIQVMISFVIATTLLCIYLKTYRFGSCFYFHQQVKRHNSIPGSSYDWGKFYPVDPTDDGRKFSFRNVVRF
jgi:hypothetical protein